MNILKQTVGIDVSMNTIDAAFGTINSAQETRISKSKSFPNNLTGFKKLISWVFHKLIDENTPLVFVMEATGSYYESLAFFLAENNFELAVVLPNKVKKFADSLDIKSKTDSLDAIMLTRFGLERKLPRWNLPDPLLRDIKALTREYQYTKNLTTQIKNKLHALTHSYKPQKIIIKRLNQQLKLYKKQIEEIEAQLKNLVKENRFISQRVEKIEKIKGLGFISIITVIAETNGFALIRNLNQLASYAGLDVKLNSSGKIRGRTTISKKGNSHIRRALFMHALSACRFNQYFKEHYQNLYNRKNNKMIAVIAVERKLLLLIYTIWIKNEDYNPLFNN